MVTQPVQQRPSHVSVHAYVFCYVRDLEVVEKLGVAVLLGAEPDQHGLLLLCLHFRRLFRLVCAKRLYKDAFDLLLDEYVHFDLGKQVALLHGQHGIIERDIR